MIRACIGCAVSLAALTVSAPGTARENGDTATPSSGALTGLRAGVWHRVFTPEVELTMGRSVRIDSSAMTRGGLGRAYKQADTLLASDGPWRRGTTVYYRRSVNCATGASMTHGWAAYSARGTLVGSGGAPSRAKTMQWDTPQGRVLGFVCKGIRPR